MNQTTEDIKDMLESSAYGVDGLAFGTNVFIGTMPDTPDLCVGLYDTGGYPPDEAQSGTYYPTLQIRVRGGAYRAAYLVAQSIRNSLHQITNETYNSTRYIYIFASGDVLYIGKDDKDRPLFSINFRVAKTG